MSRPELAVPLFDIEIGAADRAAVDEVLRSGWLTMGPRTAAFEDEFAAHVGTRHAVALSSCTAALHLALLAAGVGPGDEVIVPAITFVATANAVRYCGATPVLADVRGLDDLGIDPDHVERLVTSRTRAVCAVHYAGYAAAVADLRALCDARGLALIEDAAHSPSARPVGSDRRLGGWGLAGAFSFFSNKVLSCGEGGLLATDDDEVAATARSLRSHALTSGTWDRHRGHAHDYDVVGLGYNYRLDEARAALLSSRLAGLEADVAARRRIVHRYRRELAKLDGITVPYRDEEVDASSCYVMPTMLEAGRERESIRALMLERHGVQTSVLYPSIADFTAFEELDPGQAPVSQEVAERQLTLPLFPHMTESQQDVVLEALAAGLAATRS